MVLRPMNDDRGSKMREEEMKSHVKEKKSQANVQNPGPHKLLECLASQRHEPPVTSLKKYWLAGVLLRELVATRRETKVQSDLKYTIYLRVIEGIINCVEGSSTPRTKKNGHSHVSIAMATIESPCGRSRGIPNSHLHGELSVLMLLGICQLLVRSSGSHGLGRVANTSASTPASLMQSQECINLHNGEVVAEQNVCRHINDILRTTPQVRE